jgi:hypothetical protein
MAGSSNANGGVRYTLIYQDATSLPSDNVGGGAFNLSNPVPAGLIEAIGLRISGTAGAQPSAASTAEIISGVRFTLNGDQVINLQTNVNDTTNANCSRIGAMVQDVGGMVVEETQSPTDIDMTVWIPLGINAPVNSRFELALNYITALATITGNFELWIKYGKSTNLTLYGNQTSQTIADNAQTMVSVKIPTVKGATVAGIMVQGNSNVDNLISVIPKVLGDFAMSPTYLRGISGASMNGYQYADPGANATAQLFNDAIPGYYFVPLYNVAVSDGSVVFLITSENTAVPGSEFYTFTPVLNLPTSGSGERTPVQTARVATGSKGAILSRAEDQ